MIPTMQDKIHDNRFWVLFRNAFCLRCPVCKTGKIFPGWLSTAEYCPVCGVEIEREAGYFLGSIYFNFGATGVLTILGYFLLYFGLRWSNQVTLIVMMSFTVLFPLFFFRYARSSWLVFDQYFHPRFPPHHPRVDGGSSLE